MLKVAFLAGLGREEEAGIEIEETGEIIWMAVLEPSSQGSGSLGSLGKVLVCLATRSVVSIKG